MVSVKCLSVSVKMYTLNAADGGLQMHVFHWYSDHGLATAFQVSFTAGTAIRQVMLKGADFIELHILCELLYTP